MVLYEYYEETTPPGKYSVFGRIFDIYIVVGV
jgi:hypothetical protein